MYGNIFTYNDNNIFHDAYHPNADRWTTARTLSLSGDASGSVSWDGSGNATLSVTVADNSHNHDYVPERSRTDWNDSTVISDVIGQLAWKNYGNNHTIFDASASTSPSGTSVNNTNPNVPWTGTYPTLMGWNGANTYGVRVDSSRFADRWTTARTLSLSGDASGSVSWDGSGNATLSVAVADDSHSHSQVFIPDTRGAARAPNYYPDNNVSFDFQNTADTGAGGDTWHVLQTVVPWSTYNAGHRQQQLAFTGAGGIKFRYATSETAWASWQTLWTSGNDGSGSGLDADLLDGLQLHTGRNNEANRVVRTQGNGYAEFGWINTTSGDTSAALSRIYVDTGDGYIRKSTLAHVASQLPIDAGAPAGSIIYHAGSSAPSGYIKANGASLSTSTYSALFSAIGYTYGGSGGSFNVPDLRGEFIRGWDDGRGVDSGRGFGSFQSDDFASHTHTQYGGLSAQWFSVYARSGNWGNERFFTYHTTPTLATGGADTRPRNRALLACIKT